MNDKELTAVKQALEVLEKDVRFYKTEKQAAITALRSIISQDAIYKMADESRTSGLRLDDWDKIGCVNHDCDECKAVQSAERGEPVAWMQDSIELYVQDRPSAYYTIPLYTTPPIVATPLAAPKPWEGLTNNEIALIHADYPNPQGFARAIEAKLKAKNERKEKNT
jgi:hypothetical protein